MGKTNRFQNGLARVLSVRQNTQELQILFLGLVLALVYSIGLGFYLFTQPEKGSTLVAVTTTNLILGRAPGMALAYSGGFGILQVSLVNMAIETFQVLIFYPLFVLSWNHLLEIRILSRTMKNIHSVAEARKHWIQKYGIIGLFIFVFFPFWMTGPVVGCVIGFLIGLRPWTNMVVVLGGTYVAVVVWAFLLNEVHIWAAEFGSFVPVVMILGIVLVMVIHRLSKNRQKRRETH